MAASRDGQPEAPKTPTRKGNNTESSTISKLTPVADQASRTGSSATPRKPPKLGQPKSASRSISSPKLPPRPKVTNQDTPDTKESKSQTQGSKGAKRCSPGDTPSESSQRIGMKDNEKPEKLEEPEDFAQSRPAQDDTDVESTSAADSGELDEANPEPIHSEDEDIVADQNDEQPAHVTHELGTESGSDVDTEERGEDKAEHVEREDSKGTLSGTKSTLGGLTGGAKNLAGRTSGGARNVVGSLTNNASKGDIAGAAKDTTGDVKDTAQDAAGDVKNTTSDTAKSVRDTAEGVAKDVPKSTDVVPATANDIQQKATGTTDNIKDTVTDTVDDAEETVKNTGKDANDTIEDVKDTAEKNMNGAKEKASTTVGEVQGARENVQDRAEGAIDKTQDQTDNAGDSAEKTVGSAKNLAKDTVANTRDMADNTKGTAEDLAEDTTDEAQALTEDQAGDAEDQTKITDMANEATHQVDQTKETADGVKDKIQGSVNGAVEALPTDLSVLKGLQVQDTGDVLNKEGRIIGRLEEGDPTDLEGYEVGDDGEILDEDGDVVGRVSLVADQAEDTADQARNTAEDLAHEAKDQAGSAIDDVETYLPDINVLQGLEVLENGEILGKDGNVLGRINEGDPADLVGMTLNEDGEVLDEDGDVVGRAEVLQQEIKQQTSKAQDELPSLDVLDGLKVGEGGAIKGSDGKILGKITEGDPSDLIGRAINTDGEVLDEDGDVIGRAEVVPTASKALNKVEQEAHEISPEFEKVQELEQQLAPNLDILEGRKLNKKGNILDDEGEVLAKLVEGDSTACRGLIPNENGEILNKSGNIIGRVEVVSGEAAEEAMREAHPELVEQLEEAQKAADEADVAANEAGEDAVEKAGDVVGEAGSIVDETKDAADSVVSPSLSQLKGLKANKKGEVLDQDGNVVAKLSEGNIKDIVGKKLDEKGQILDKDGNVLGKVELVSEGVEEISLEASEVGGDQELPTSVLEGYKVNKKGDVLNEEGEVIARLSEGELDTVAGQKLNKNGEITDKDGNIIGKVEMVDQKTMQAGEDADNDLPPSSVLSGFKLNKSGKVIDSGGNIIGELTEGDAKKIWKLGATADDEGQFWDNKGHVIGKAKTLAREDEDTEAPFAGLKGLVVVKEGYVEDENGNRVGTITEGDKKKLVGRAVDEDGDVIDKKGNVVGHAERYDEPDEEREEEEAPIDLSELKGLTCNKQGNVMDRDGIHIARLVQGNPAQLAGRKIDGNGQIWNDSGEAIGKCELIPPEQREDKPEGPFAGREGLVVMKDGLVEDHDGNVVGKVVDGNWKKLLGRAVDEDGDIVDKHGNVKGHVEPYEMPEEETVEDDLSSLAGKTVNKQGKLVDEHGTIYGEVSEGNAKRLVGCKCDAQGQIWSNDGKVIGKGRLIAGGDDGRSEGPFSNFESTVVSKDGLVKDNNGEIVGRVIDGDAKKLVGRKVDDEGDIVDKNGNVIGKAERWEPEEKEREVNLMSGMRVNKQGEVRDKNGDTIGRLTDGNMLHCIGREIDDNGYVVDQDGNKLGEVTLLEKIPDEEEEVEEEVEEGPTEGELKDQEERETAKKIGNIIQQTIEKMEPICKQIDEHIDRADRTPRDELDEEKLVEQVKPLIEEGSRTLQECNGSIRGLDPDGHIAAQAKAKAAAGEASPEQHRVAEGLKELTTNIVKTIDSAKKKIADMPHAKKKLSPLWGLLTEPLFQIIAAVGLLLSGVLGLVGKLLNGLGLGGLVNGILGGLGVNKLLDGIGLGSVGEALGLGGGGKKK